MRSSRDAFASAYHCHARGIAPRTDDLSYFRESVQSLGRHRIESAKVTALIVNEGAVDKLVFLLSTELPQLGNIF